MKKILYLFILLALLVSCKSKKAVVATVTKPQLPDTTTVVTPKVVATPPPPKVTPPQTKDKAPVVTAVVAQPKITSSVVNLPVAPGGGVERMVKYEFTHPDVPKAFDGFRMAFITDLHYKSLLQEEGLNRLVDLLNVQKPDALLMGGDYQEGCEYVKQLFDALARVKTPMGTYGVMGNNDYERCHDEVVKAMESHDMHVLEHTVGTLRKGGQQIRIAGVANPFDLKKNGVSPTIGLSPQDFVVLLVHTPDYVEDVSVANTDLALAGHTHGGQVSLFGITPIQNSHYGTRFLTGLAYNSAKTPLIVSNGIGTSQMPIRVGAPAEVILITLKRP